VRVENKHDGYAPPWRPALTPPSWIDLRDQKFESGFLQRGLCKLQLSGCATTSAAAAVKGPEVDQGGLEKRPVPSRFGTNGSNPSPSSVESVANPKRHVVTVTTGLLVGAQVH
jgi:hypothetical protein